MLIMRIFIETLVQFKKVPFPCLNFFSLFSLLALLIELFFPLLLRPSVRSVHEIKAAGLFNQSA